MAFFGQRFAQMIALSILAMSQPAHTQNLGIRLSDLAKWAHYLLEIWKDQEESAGREPCIPIDVMKPPHGRVGKWCPGQHESIDTALLKVAELRDTDISNVILSYDFGHKRITIESEDNMVQFLRDSRMARARDKKISLLVDVVSSNGLGRALSGLAGRAQAMSRKMLDTFISMVSKKKVDTQVLSKHEDRLKDMTKVSELIVQGDVKKFEGVPVDEWNNTVNTLENDVGVPKKITSTLRLASKFTQGCQESSYALDFTDGKLNAAYLVRLIAKKTPVGDLNLVLFYFSLSFTNSQVTELGFDENVAIESYVDSKGHSFWADRLAVEIPEDVLEL